MENDKKYFFFIGYLHIDESKVYTTCIISNEFEERWPKDHIHQDKVGLKYYKTNKKGEKTLYCEEIYEKIDNRFIPKEMLDKLNEYTTSIKLKENEFIEFIGNYTKTDSKD